MTRSEAAKRAGQLGGATTRERHGTAHYAAIGAVGGTATRERHGTEYFQRLGRLSAERRAARRQEQRG